MGGKEGIGPALMIASSTAATAAQAATKDTSNTHPYPSVHLAERFAVAMFEVFKPASDTTIDFPYDRIEALAVGAFGLRPYRFLELLEALVARPSVASLEVIPKEVKTATLRGVNDMRLVGVKRQLGFIRPVSDLFQRTLGLLFTAAQDHEVIGITHHLESRFCHIVVERIEIDIGQQRAYHRTLRTAHLRCPALGRLRDILFEIRLD